MQDRAFGQRMTVRIEIGLETGLLCQFRAFRQDEVQIAGHRIAIAGRGDGSLKQVGPGSLP